MSFFKSTVVLCVACCSAWGAKAGMLLQDSMKVSITGIDVLAQATSKWTTASDVTMGIATVKIDYEKGAGILLHKAGPDNTPVSLTATVSGDLELDLDFMVSAESDPVLYFLGKYPITLAGDKPGSVEISTRAENPLFRISTPTVNVAKAPGLWQHLKIRYRAGMGNGAGTKGAGKPNFEAIYLNGVLIHQQLYLDVVEDNTATNPLLSFLCRDGHVAFRNIYYRHLEAPKTAATPPRRFYRITNPIILNPGTKPYLLRSYLMFGGEKRTHVISVGNPNHSNFSYDLKQGALLQVWKGEFVDVTAMWESRGEPQTATPLGALVELTAKPSIAVLRTADESWPDSIAFDDMHNKGYTVDAAGVPTFQYEFSGMQVSDRISAATDGNSLTRALTISNPGEHVNCLVAVGKNVVSLGKGVYAVNDKSYYVKIDRQSGAFVRKTPDGEELIIPVQKDKGQISYSLIW